MTYEAVRIADEDLIDLLPEIERSFAIRLPRDLGRIETVGDLFDVVVAQRAPGGGGDRVSTSMAFYALRRALAPLWDEPDAAPATRLGDKGLPSPARLATLLGRKTGLELPARTLSMFGCLAAGGLAIGGGIALLSGYNVLGLLLLVGAAAWLKFDSGEFSREWETLGSLAAATVDLNYAALAEAGARDTESDSWRSFCALLAPHARAGRDPADPRRIGRDTRLDVD